MSEHDTQERIDRFVRLIAESKAIPVWVLVGTTYVAPSVPTRTAVLVNVDSLGVVDEDSWARRVQKAWSAPPEPGIFFFQPYIPLQITDRVEGQNPCGEVGIPSMAFSVAESPWASVADPRFPHSCPRCGGAAYVGMAEVDCRARCA